MAAYFWVSFSVKMLVLYQSSIFEQFILNIIHICTFLTKVTGACSL